MSEHEEPEVTLEEQIKILQEQGLPPEKIVEEILKEDINADINILANTLKLDKMDIGRIKGRLSRIKKRQAAKVTPRTEKATEEGEPLYKGELDTTSILKDILTKHPDIPSKVVDEVCSWAEYGPIHPTQLVSLLQSFRGITATTAYIIAQKYALALQKAQQEGKVTPMVLGGPVAQAGPQPLGFFPTSFPTGPSPMGGIQPATQQYGVQPSTAQYGAAPQYGMFPPWQPPQDIRSLKDEIIRGVEERLKPKEAEAYVDIEEPVRDSEGKVIIGPDDRAIVKRMRVPASQAGQYQPYPPWQRPEDVGSVVKREIDDMKKYVDTKLETLRPKEEGYVEISEPLRTPEGKVIVDGEGNPLVRTVRAPVSQASQIALGGDPELRFLEKMKHYRDLFGKEELTSEKVRSIIKEEVPKEKVEAKPVTPEEVQKAVAEASTKAAQTVLAEVQREDKEEKRHRELLNAVERSGGAKIVEGYKQDAYRFLGQGMGEVARVAEKKEPIKIIIQGARDILAGPPPPKEIEEGAREGVLTRLPPQWVAEE